MNDDSVVGGIGSNLGNLGKQIGLSTLGAPVDVAKTAAGQVGIHIPTEEKKDGDRVAEGNPRQADQKTIEDIAGKQKAEEFKKLMYAPSSFDQNASDPNSIAQLATQGSAKTPEEQAKIAQLQQQLQAQHTSTYYDPTFNKPQVSEERAQEKVEREEEEKKMAEFEFVKEEKKKQPIDVIMAQNKTEQFRGVSG